VADSAEALVDAIVRVTGDARERERLAHAARAQVEAKYTWPRALERLDRVVGQCLCPPDAAHAAAQAA